MKLKKVIFPSNFINFYFPKDILKGKEEEDCVEFIEELIVNQEPLQKVLRLICLMSIVQNGLSEKTYDFLRKELIHV